MSKFEVLQLLQYFCKSEKPRRTALNRGWLPPREVSWSSTDWQKSRLGKSAARRSHNCWPFEGGGGSLRCSHCSCTCRCDVRQACGTLMMQVSTSSSAIQVFSRPNEVVFHFSSDQKL